jgi:TonB-dependent receptor-like protein
MEREITRRPEIAAFPTSLGLADRRSHDALEAPRREDPWAPGLAPASADALDLAGDPFYAAPAMRRSPSTAALALALLAAVATPARADAPRDPPIEITVHGSTSGGFASQVSTDTAPREPVDAASMLAELPSVHVRRLGSDGSFATLSIRGSASSQVGVVLAGIPLTSAADPSFDVGSLPLWPGASFRVYRGFAPASLGTTGYLGGVLAVDPPTAALGARTEAWLAAGSFGSLKMRAGDTRKVGDLQLGGGVFASRSDGDFSYDLANPATGQLASHTRTNAGHAAVGAIERVALERPWGSVGALVYADARRLGVPGSAAYSTEAASLTTSRVVVGADASIHTAAAGAVRLLAWGRREASTLADPLGELDATHTTSTSSVILAGGLSAGWRGRPRSSLTVDVRLDARAERFAPDTGDRGLLTVPASRIAGGGGAEIEWRPTEKLAITASARLDARRDDPSGSTGFDGKTPLPIASDFAPTGHLGASYRLADAAVISAHAGALGRPPSFQELYGNGASLVGDAELRPERALSADAGIHGDLGDRRAAFAYEVVGFVTSARDLIAFVPLGIATFKAENIDRALLAGAEVSASFTARGLRSQVSYTFLFTRNQSGDPISDGRPLVGRPQQDLAYDASYRFGPASVRYGLDALEGVTADTEGTLVLPPRILHSAGASIDLPFQVPLRIGLDAQNLGDLRTIPIASHQRGSVTLPYSEFPGFPLPGRSFWLTLRMQTAR